LHQGAGYPSYATTFRTFFRISRQTQRIRKKNEATKILVDAGVSF